MSSKILADSKAAQTKTGNLEAQEASEKKNGRPKLDDNDKEDSTITKEASL